MAYELKNPDFEKSPFTGMTRDHWVECAKFLVDGVFQHIKGMDDPIVIPKQSKVSYPQADDPKHRFQAAELEGLARTFMAAAPVISDLPDAVSNGLNLRDYYAHQILQATDPESPRYAGSIVQFNEEYGKMQYQQTVEGGALVVGLMQCREQIWERYSTEEKQQVATLLSDYAHSQTIGHNWRFFNVLMLTFLKVTGFEIDEVILKDHLQHLMAQYSGDGWYNDDPCYDLYNPWGYHFYGPLWCRWYGYEHEPEIAAVIEKRNREFIENWPRFYSREGHQLMWGRSLNYRFGNSAALGGHFLMNDPVLNPGFARRIASANMLQFVTRDDLYVNGVPCLGYYGPFEPLIQFYSCAASPFWVAKIFVALSLPKDSPFWTAEENEGFWPELGDRTETVELEGPGIQVINRGDTGASEILTGKVPQHSPYYNQLSFNADYCYEDESERGSNPINYSVRDLGGGGFRIPLTIGFNRFEDGVMYRTLNMKAGMGANSLLTYVVNKGMERIDLADLIIPGGVIRVDRIRLPYSNQLHLGHYALPHFDGKSANVEPGTADGCKTLTGSIKGRKLAMTSVHGWENLQAAKHQGKNSEAEESTVIYANRTVETDYSGMELLITVMLHRQDNGNWSNDELMPIRSYELLPWAPSGQPCGVKLELKDGRTITVDFGNVEGNLT
ncbi:DUF2264 domain-containing protein [Pontiella sulfatireligans]|uniref:DUF2264 domain-containing protein n=1 Tax=Pontiella sulfatireligans TaxID=2750658 RepID=A0A6C2UI41_9BACT|nr:DUF2264 domain-containing protein [Pontiella sulfatireligans]VGO19081.1 hypothetical protein SCARR_01137 [Pontiella sulfatireligans]